MKIVEGKVVVLGSQGVGKTSMITKYTGQLLDHQLSPTIGASFFNCKVNLDNTIVKIQVWDTAGQERFASMAPMYYRGANAAFLVFDLTQYKSFTAIKTWVNELKTKIEEPMVLIVVGNKCDLINERKIDSEEGRLYAMRIGASYHETSALYDEGIEQVFIDVARGILRLDNGERDSTNIRITEVSFRGDDCLTPSSEEVLTNMSIAHGIHEKPSCC